MARELVVYGAYGYTGKLVAEALVARGLHPILAGRNGARLQSVAESMNCHRVAVALGDAAGLRGLTKRAAAVLHCAGPFRDTAAPMRAACLATGTHYIDITGEVEVLQASAEADAAARATGIMLMSGGGFDVVPTDCIAAMLKARLPDATKLTLAFSTTGGASRGTMRTSAAYLADAPLVRRKGELAPRRGRREARIDFGDGPVKARAVSWGDIVTAWHSTGIAEIEAFMVLPPDSRKLVTAPWLLRKFLTSSWGKGRVEKALANLPDGPDAHARAEGHALVYGRVVNAEGMVVELRLRTAEAYQLTALSMAEIGARVMQGDAPIGYQTPSTAYGAEFVLTLPGSAMIR
ncbi:saccharopine dehydrogenase family protein [Pararhodobacter zhoushanensis]|uniref:saccharopine dehydrogenase family protein n=1 Tax=Pararhodobacter zhoushanensis TaxID=2479545 RepID=UPI000F8F0933|nr:saccharopine dehydrogenase NADP-binding domain-containing protein [Pararhodobacter zhoushanensis]